MRPATGGIPAKADARQNCADSSSQAGDDEDKVQAPKVFSASAGLALVHSSPCSEAKVLGLQQLAKLFCEGNKDAFLSRWGLPLDIRRDVQWEIVL